MTPDFAIPPVKQIIPVLAQSAGKTAKQALPMTALFVVPMIIPMPKRTTMLALFMS